MPLVHIFNHRSPCDGLVIQGVLRMPGLTTAQLHLRWVLPQSAANAARNAGSAVLDHRQPQSRLAGMMSASTLLRDHGEIMIAPNGSLVTPIEERVSPSAWMLAQHYGGAGGALVLQLRRIGGGYRQALQTTSAVVGSFNGTVGHDPLPSGSSR